MQEIGEHNKTMQNASIYPANEAIAFVRNNMPNGEHIATFNNVSLVLRTVTEQGTKIYWPASFDDEDEAYQAKQNLQQYTSMITHEESG